ncbi:YjbF family lipoprotein [Aliiroseovarius sp. KMU-50]|uniref:YjbF family lipoprotein n=1 Tax=Aliiroseovarius salicola TaxID=3009082 RepID=A0ABT4W4C4_9RHOB|nr:YjbF family lipoprotein [Aliiroseovarius sp. KMU-50]MDA5095378.1 YjbF family lipoprotein [Aliiroseovarius sp. KMU-50]
MSNDMKFSVMARPMRMLIAGVVLSLAACGSDKQTTQLPKVAGEFIKGVASNVSSRVTAKSSDDASQPSTAKADPNAAVKAALAATPGPINLVIRESNAAVLAMTPIETNAGGVTWMGAGGQSTTLKSGVIVATRGVGDDLMAADAGSARNAIVARRPASYDRVYDHLTGVGHTSKLTTKCTLSTNKSERLVIGEINSAAVVMKEDCAHPNGIKFENLYWVASSGRILKSRQWISQGVGYLIVQPLR